MNIYKCHLISFTKRKIKRDVISKPARVIQNDESDEDKEDDDKVDENKQKYDEEQLNLDTSVWLIGTAESIAKAKLDFKIKLDYRYTECIENTTFRDFSVQILRENEFCLNDIDLSNNRVKVASKGDVEIREKETRLVLSGLIGKEVRKVKDDLMLLLISSNKTEYPSTWDLDVNETSGNDVELVNVTLNSPEWAEIESEFRKTMPLNDRITCIRRIQNKPLWKHYAEEKKFLIEKRGSDAKANEKRLWHGTRATKPSEIYEQDKIAFDFRYCENGMWGRGSYFAQNANYSRAYAYADPTTNGVGLEKEFFYCLVLLGDCVALPSDSSLRMPPYKTNATSSSKNNTKKHSERYDSVQGNTGGSDVFVVYEHAKAYPSYLVKFAAGN